MTEIEKVKAEIKVLEKKLSFLEELSQTKTPCEEAYKKVFGFYPMGRANGVWTISDEDTWIGFQNGYNAAQDYNVGEYQEPKENEWKSVALRFGEKLVSISPCGYYEYTPEGWYEWVVNTYEKLADDWLSLLKKEKIKKEKVEKSKINDLAEKLLPDDHPYKIADEHGETNPYKQGLNMIKKDKKTEELMTSKGYEKNSTGFWEPKPQNENEVAEGLREAFREAVKQGIIPEIDEISDEFMDEMVAKLKGKTLYDICMEWCNDDYHKDFINDLISRIEEWLPKPQNSDGSQNVYVECAVEGYNDAIKQIKSKLR